MPSGQRADSPAGDRAAASGVRARWLEAAGWVVIVAVLWGADLLARMAERDLTGVGKDDFRLISEQVTSAVAVLVMIPFVLRWLAMFPLRRDAWVPAVIGHTVGSVFFAFGHHSLMIALRIPWYALHGIDYVWRTHFVSNLVVEYQKDIKIYAGILLVATAWGLYRRARASPAVTDRSTAAGTASSATGTPLPVAPAPHRGEAGPAAGGRLRVQTGKGEGLLRYDDIESLEAARNYVTIHAAGREYLVRDTMAALARRLADGPFLRVHRSHIVNLDQIEEIRPAGSGQRIRLRSGREIPLGRAYRSALDARLSR